MSRPRDLSIVMLKQSFSLYSSVQSLFSFKEVLQVVQGEFMEDFSRASVVFFLANYCVSTREVVNIKIFQILFICSVQDGVTLIQLLLHEKRLF